MNKTAKIIFYLIAGVFSFLFFVILLFPLQAIIGHYLANLESQTKGQYRVTISKMDPSLLFDSEFEDFHVYQKNGADFREIFYAPKIRMGISLISLLSSTVNVNFTASLSKGKLSGGVMLTQDKSVCDLKFDKVSLSDLVILSHYVPVKISGEVNGNLYLALQADIRKSEGDFKIKIAGLHTDPYFIKEANMEIPALSLSVQENEGLIEGGMDQGFLTVSTFSLPGADINMQMKGRVQFLRNNITRSNLNGKFKLSDKFESEVPVLGFIAEQKTPEGFYPLSIAGDLKKPRITIGTLKLSDMLNLKF